jgi:hypothetical protein
MSPVYRRDVSPSPHPWTSIAEYERMKITERYRRGKLFRARQGEVVFWIWTRRRALGSSLGGCSRKMTRTSKRSSSSRMRPGKRTCGPGDRGRGQHRLERPGLCPIPEPIEAGAIQPGAAVAVIDTDVRLDHLVSLLSGVSTHGIELGGNRALLFQPLSGDPRTETPRAAAAASTSGQRLRSAGVDDSYVSGRSSGAFLFLSR